MPRVEGVVHKEMVRALAAMPTLAGLLLRMHFHQRDAAREEDAWEGRERAGTGELRGERGDGERWGVGKYC